MSDMLKISIAQIAPVVGDIDGNVKKISAARKKAAARGVDLVILPELVVSGYPPEDLVLKPAYQIACREAVYQLARETNDGGPAVLIGAPWTETEQGGGKPFNAALFCDRGEVVAIVYKTRLPNYGVFDEPRRYRAGKGHAPVQFRGVKLGIMICEDMWYPEAATELKEQGAELLIVPHGSPFRVTAQAERFAIADARIAETGLPVIFVNQLGGQDELIFDGASFVAGSDGDRFLAPAFEEGVFLTQWAKRDDKWVCTEGPEAIWPTEREMMYQALVVGVREYVNKNHFPGVFIGLSGGVDSALTAAIAVDALGPDRVRCVMLPSRYTSTESLTDAKECAAGLGVYYESISIEPAVGAFDEMLSPIFQDREADITEENIQSRIRGVLLMALSNKFGHMVLTTGNKSEMSVGYATLYGDMNGGYNPLKDIYKTDAFALCYWRNKNIPAGALGPQGQVVPENIITKPPSAELREDQKDADSLPPYEVLDDILQGLVEDELSVREIVAGANGRPPQEEQVVRRVQHLLYVAEYKRRQAPPGPKVTVRSFGRDRRYPITNGFRDS